MTSSELPPQHVQILIIGGGPSGSYAAAALAREGFDVVLFEAAQFPRYHIGESLIPSVRQYLEFIDAEEKIASHGFAFKPGSAIKFNQYKREGYTDFVALGHGNAAWNVIRSEFDHILLQHAASSGARVFERTRVNSIIFDSESADLVLRKPVSATYTSFESSTPSNITFDYLVDATGRSGLLSTKYFNNRTFTDSLKNIAIWGYWSGANSYGDGTSRHGAPWFEALTDESGWAWFIPLHNGLTSIGVVMNQPMFNARTRSSTVRSPPSSAADTAVETSQSSIASIIKTRLRSLTLPLSSRPSIHPTSRKVSNLANRYHDSLKLAPGLASLIGDGILVHYPVDKQHNGDQVHMASDYSYSASKYSGNGWRIIGDSGAFIDPFFSSGVHLAFTGALSAAATISASIRGHCTEQEAADWHHERVATSYTRFLIVVLSAYKQIRAQNMNVLSDVDEDNFDKAFKFIRPVIQGGADMGLRLSEDELQRSLDFCGKLFSPTSPDEHEATRTLLASCDMSVSGGQDLGVTAATRIDFMDVKSPIIGPEHIDQLSIAASQQSPDQQTTAVDGSPPLGPDHSAVDVRMILEKVNARRVIHSEHGSGVSNFEEEALGGGSEGGGFVVRLVTGQLGLVKVEKRMPPRSTP